MTLHTTARLAKRADACREEMKKVSKALGGVKSYGIDTPIPLAVVLEHTSLDSALWALRCVLPGEESARDRIARLFACECAARVLTIFERDRPGDDRPRRAIETARRFATGEATREELAAAWAAAGSAAWAAAGAAAWDAAWAAAGSAARAAAGSAAWAAAWAAAWDAARAAARDAAGSAAWDAARDAARDAECAEQVEIFLRLLGAESREEVRP